jgi:integrin alpha FG-GAP repeat containing protein 1
MLILLFLLHHILAKMPLGFSRVLSAPGRIAAFADVNGDRLIDLFIIDGSDLNIFSLNDGYKTIQTLSLSSAKVSNIIPTDLNHDGKLDLLVSYEVTESDGWSSTIYLDNTVYIGNGANFTQLSASFKTKLSQPFIADLTGKMEIDIVGHQPKADNLTTWKVVGDRVISNASTIVDAKSGRVPCKLAHPHSNAFVDLDGDCLADLFLTCESDPQRPRYEIWLNRKEDGFVFAMSLDGVDGAGQMTFEDVDSDGTLDLVFPACPKTQKTCMIYVVYNQQMGLCGNGVTPCRDKTNLCVADPNLKFDFAGSEVCKP